jgi:hypothetical protein
MRKLVVLKSIVDFIWIVCCIPLMLLLTVFLLLSFFKTESLSAMDSVNFMGFEGSKIAIIFRMVVLYIVTALSVYSFFLFRKSLRYFMKAKPFHEKVILIFDQIGRYLVLVSLIGLFFSFLDQLLFSSKIVIGIGFWPYLFIACLGLFFKVLSEIFKIAKHAKEENQLTI